MYMHAGQSGIPEGVVTRCYDTVDCTGQENIQLSQLFNDSRPAEDLNYCCFNEDMTPRSGISSLSFTLNGGACRRCDGKLLIIATQSLTIAILCSYMCMYQYIYVYV